MSKTLHHYEDDFEFTMAVHDAWKNVLGITGDRSTLIFSDEAMAVRGAAKLGTTNPLDVLGYKPFVDDAAAFTDIQLEIPRDEFFGGPTSRTFQKRLPIDTTLFMILKAVDEGFQTTGDYHHTLLEGFQAEKARDPFGGNLLVIRPILGS
jgi:hypothetical protein